MRHTGKTTISKYIYIDLMESVQDACGYIIDSNAAGDFTGWSGAYSGFDCPIIHPSRSGRQIVWQPPQDNFNAYEDFFGRLFYTALHTGIPAIVFLDELSCLGGGEHHDNYAMLLKRGRKRPSFPGITVISVSQELAQRARVPRQTFTQMVHFFKFYVQHPYDLMEANRLLHLPQRIQPEHEHGFWYARMDAPPIQPKYYRGIEAA